MLAEREVERDGVELVGAQQRLGASTELALRVTKPTLSPILEMMVRWISASSITSSE